MNMMTTVEKEQAEKSEQVTRVRTRYSSKTRELNGYLDRIRAIDDDMLSIENEAIALLGTANEAAAAGIFGARFQPAQGNPSGSGRIETWKAYVERELGIRL
jgi:hypothetical protein